MLGHRFFALLLFTLITASATTEARKTFQLVWREDFNPCEDDGNLCVNGVSTSNWSFEEGDGSKYGPYMTGWGNNEIQCYTKSPQNVRVLTRSDGARGVLAIEAVFHEHGISCANPGAPSSTRYWSSARVMTRGKAAFGFEATGAVKFEALVKIPQEWGAWSAFWLMPNTERTDCLGCGDFGNGWCSSGEVDILEARNRDGLLQSTLHFGGLKDSSWLGCNQATGTLNAGASMAYWNRVSTVMSASNISFFVNDSLVHSVPSSSWYTGAVAKTEDPLAPFNRPFYMLLNLAVGGNYVTAQTNGHVITDTRRAPYRYLIDWVRVYTEIPRGSSSISGDSGVSSVGGGRRSLRAE